MCVFVENAGLGAAVAAPIARQILQKFFGHTPVEIVIPKENYYEDSKKDAENQLEIKSIQ
jgi:hypothetical protein